MTEPLNIGQHVSSDPTMPTVRFASGTALVSESATLESKTVSVDVRGKTSERWTEYAEPTVRIAKTTDPAGNVTTTAYDLGHGKPSCVTDAQGKTHCYAYDLHGNCCQPAPMVFRNL